MLPVYDPKAFDGIDLRKYHIRNIKDVIKFNEFVASRMEEAEFVLKKFNNEYATYRTVSDQLRRQVEKQSQAYGNPTVSAETKEEAKAVIQTADETAEQVHQDLLNEIKQAAAEETLVPDEGEDPNERVTAELDKYKVIAGKKGPMFYRMGEKGYKLVSKNDVPEDIKQQLLDIVEAK